MDANKTLAWKQSLIFFGGVILAIGGIFAMPFYVLAGIPMTVLGIGLWIFNIVKTISSEQPKAVKFGLLLPKLVFLLIVLLGAAYMGFIVFS